MHLVLADFALKINPSTMTDENQWITGHVPINLSTLIS